MIFKEEYLTLAGNRALNSPLKTLPLNHSLALENLRLCRFQKFLLTSQKKKLKLMVIGGSYLSHFLLTQISLLIHNP